MANPATDPGRRPATRTWSVSGAGVPLRRAEERSIRDPSKATPAVDDDRVLLDRVQARDGRAFRALVERYLPPVLGVARRMLRDDAEAEDVAQEALLKLWQGGAALEIGAGGAWPWLRRVTSNLCIDRMRSGRRTDVTDEVPEQPVAANQFRLLAESDLSTRVDAALRGLPERQRQALVLFHYEGLSQIEVGRVLGVSDEAVESLLSRARRALRGMLKDDWRLLLPGEA
jgi:RNA polymerase sigma-70 factor, ECF subfamily